MRSLVENPDHSDFTKLRNMLIRLVSDCLLGYNVSFKIYFMLGSQSLYQYVEV